MENKKTLKMSKGQPESINERRTDNIMGKRKIKKNPQISTHKTKGRVTGSPLNTGGELMCSGRVSNSCSTSITRRVTLSYKPGDKS